MQRTKRRLLVSAIPVLSVLLPLTVQAESLDELYQLAIQNDLTLQAARYTRDSTIEARPRAMAALLPQVTGTAQYRENKLTRENVDTVDVDNPADTPGAAREETFTSTQYAINLQQALFNWPAFKTLAQSDKQVAQAEATYRSAQQGLIVRLVQSYFAVLAAQDALRADLDAQTSFKQQLDQQQEKYRGGVGTVTDAKNAQASYDSSTAQVIADRNALAAAKRALSTIVGRTVETVDAIQDELTLVPPNPNTVESWVAAASSENFDVISARFSEEAAGYQLSATRGRYLPTLSAVGSITEQDSKSRFGYASGTDFIGLSLSMDIYRGGQNVSTMRAAEAALASTQTATQLQLRLAEQSVRDHYDGVINGIAQVKASSAAVSSNQSSVIATEVGFKVGTRTVIDILTARQSLAAAQKSFSTARNDYLLSLLQLKAEVGQLTAADILDIDRLLIRRTGAESQPAPAVRGQ